MSILKSVAAGLLATTALVAAATAAQAQDFKPVQAGDIVVRARALAVVPQEKGTVNVAGVPVGDARIKNDYIPEIDATYFVTPNVGLNLIAGTSRHSVSTDTGISAGKVSLLPPTLTVTYHPLPASRINPYVGAGINYTIFYNVKDGAVPDMDYKNSFGWALQAGTDIYLTNNLLLNFDVKKLFLDTTVKGAGGAVRADVDINPWIVGVGVGYRF